MSTRSDAGENPAVDARLQRVERRGRGRCRKLIIGAVTFIGICEALTMSPAIPWDALPGAVSIPITLIGFGAFIVLVGMFGNAAAAVGLMLVGRLRWQWPLWHCLAAATPYIYVTYRVVPKPW